MVAVTASVIPSVGSTSVFYSRMRPATSDLFKATGAVTQTADTSQMTWAGTLSAQVNTFEGYEMFAFADSLQATAPIFVKVEYGWGGVTANPQIRVSVGTATNGAGTLTGVVSSAAVVCQASANAFYNNTVAGTCYANGSAADAALLWAGWMPTAIPPSGPLYGGGVLLIERSRDFDGTPNADGVLIQRSAWGTTAASTESLRFTPAGLPQTATTVGGGMIMLPPNVAASTTSTGGTKTHFFPYYTGAYGTSVGGPSKYVVGALKGDFGPGAVVSVPVYGVTKSFLACSIGLGGNHDALNQPTPATSLCLRVD